MGDLRKKWKLWINGLGQAIYSGIAASLALLVANGVFDLSLGLREFGLVVAGTVIGHVAGYFMKSPIPEIFDVDDADITQDN